MEEMNNIYEAEVIEVTDLGPIEAEEVEEAGMSTGMAMAIAAIGTAGLILIGKKAIEGGKKLLAKRKAKKASEAAEAVVDAECDDVPAEEAVPENA